MWLLLVKKFKCLAAILLMIFVFSLFEVLEKQLCASLCGELVNLIETAVYFLSIYEDLLVPFVSVAAA